MTVKGVLGYFNTANATAGLQVVFVCLSILQRLILLSRLPFQPSGELSVNLSHKTFCMTITDKCCTRIPDDACQGAQLHTAVHRL